jgi:uncharacterized membrane protein YeiH
LDRRAFFWVEHATLLWALLGSCIAEMMFIRARRFAPTETAMQWPDVVGLGLCTAGVAQVAMQAGMPAIVSLLMGVGTAVFGGVLRDIVRNEIPSAFCNHRPIAVCSFFGGWVPVATQALDAPGWSALLGAAAAAAGLRLLAFAGGFTLPQWSTGEAGDQRPQGA